MKNPEQIAGIRLPPGLWALPRALPLMLACAAAASGQLTARLAPAAALRGRVMAAAILSAKDLPATGVRGGRSARPSSSRTPGYLGIEFHDMSDDQLAAAHLRNTRGVEIVMVDHDGPAGKAGLRSRDYIVSLNGQPVGGAEALRHMIHDAGAGAQIALEVVRGGSRMTVTTQLADRDAVARDALQRLGAPDPLPSAAAQNDPAVDESASAPAADETATGRAAHGQSFLGSVLHSAPFTGLDLTVMKPQLAGFFGAPGDMGLLVQTVVGGSPAANAGLRAGDVVLRADGAPLRSEADWTRRLHASKGHLMTLSVLRDKREINMTLLPNLKRRTALEWPPASFGMDWGGSERLAALATLRRDL